MMSSRNSLVESPEVRGILQSNGQIAAKASPVEPVTTPSSPARSVGSPTRASFQSHGRTMSVMTDATSSAALRSNRFSMSFPVQPSGSMSPAHTSQSPVRTETSTIPDPTTSLAGPADTNFLTAIAAQERRVLELKEELARAEADLNKLKRQWQQHEAQKKRNDAKSVAKLQPLQTSLPAADKEEDSDGSSAWMQQEMERRKALLSANKPSNRTVFSGSRHTRTLSLLSPANRGAAVAAANQKLNGRPLRKESLSESTMRSQEMEPPQTRPKAITRASTTPDMTVDGTQQPDPLLDLGEAGKKMASGLREGLWTFWEDLRQVAIGDEETQDPHVTRQSSAKTPRAARKQSSKSSLRPSSRGSSKSKASTDLKRTSPPRKHKKSGTMSLGFAPALADPSFWSEHGVLPPNTASTPVKKLLGSPRHTKTASKAICTESTDNEAWENWEDSSPHGSGTSSIASESATLPSTVSNSTSPRISGEVNAPSSDRPQNLISNEPSTAIKDNTLMQSNATKKDPIPWPALATLGPKALRRTASHLMSEWEKSLTPSPTKEYTQRDDYMGLGAEADASSVPLGRKKD